MPQSYVDRRWWLRSGDAVSDGVVDDARRLLESPTIRARHESFLRYARLYGNAEILGLNLNEYARTRSDERLTLNVIASCIDTATAKIAKNKPAPQFLTNGADYDTRRKAEKLNKFGKGLLHVSHAYRLGPAIFRDACVFKKGWLKVYSEGKRICAERVFPWELLFDDTESMYGPPRTLIQRKFIDRAVALEAFGTTRKLRDAIAKSSPADTRFPGRDALADQIEIFEAWHLPSGEGSGDGRHVICVERGVLMDEEWARDHFPFASYTLEDPIAGWWGVGMAERLVGIQYEINRLLQKIQRAMHLLGVPRVILDASSGVPKSHLNNEIGAIITVNGMEKAPVVVTPQSVHPEVFEHLERLYARAFEEVGISQLSARSAKPAGLNSGAALREYNDIESERFVIAGQRYEHFMMDVVRLGIEEARTIPGFTVDVPDRREKVKIAWADVKLDESGYVLQCFPASILPQTPAGRMEKVQELLGAGLLQPDAAMELLDFPDLEDAMGSVNAARNAVRSRVAAMLDGDEYRSPEPYDDLQTIVTLVPRVYLEERERGCPEDRLQALRDYVDEANALIQQAQQAAAQTAAPALPADPMAAADPAAQAMPPGMAA